MLTGIDRSAFGYCFDPVQAVIESRSPNGWEAALSAALPRLGAVALSDIALDKEGDTIKPRACAMGEGVIDWKKILLRPGRRALPRTDFDAHGLRNAQQK